MSTVDDRAVALIELMVDAKVLRIGDFTGKSGRKMPYFVDFGSFRTGRHLAALGRLYAEALVDAFGREVDAVFGPAYKGIPLAVATATALADDHDLEVGVCFDRKEAKDHGEGGRLVGHRPADGDRVVIIEDVTTAGTSVRASIPLLRAHAEVEVVGLLVGMDRREQGPGGSVSALQELREQFGLRTASLATVDDVVTHLHGRRIGGRVVLDDADLARIEAYRATYGAVSTSDRAAGTSAPGVTAAGS